MNGQANRRILLIDDMPEIHADFRKILDPARAASELDDVETVLFGTPARQLRGFEVDSAYQGQQGVDMAASAGQQARPYAMAFVDMRMPPGWNGVQTIEALWQVDPAIQVVICTAYSDSAWQDVLSQLEVGDRLLILKKPFDPIEVWQLASTLTAKWESSRRARLQMDDLQGAVRERTHALQLANASIEESEQRYRLLVELSPDAILIGSAGRVVFTNCAAATLYRAAHADDLLGLALESLVAPDSLDAARRALALLDGQAGGQLHSDERALCLDGSEVDVVVTRIAFSQQGRAALQMVVRDVSEHKRLELRLQHQASHDTLTGLPNRQLLLDRLNQAIAHARRSDETLAVCFIDLDRFKWINDNLGHAAGDAVLKETAQRVSLCLREQDTVARIGGDEFILLLRDAGDGLATSRAIERVVASIAQPLTLNGKDISVTCSIGCSRYPDDGVDADELLKFADAAMYRAKQAGRNNLQVYNADLHRHLDLRQKMASALRDALAQGQLRLCYQPQVELRSGAVAGIEALLRWQHPEWGDVPPTLFIPVAEENGLIETIGAWVIEQACRQHHAWQQAGLRVPCVAVNVSFKQIELAGLAAHAAHCLDVNGLESGCLELELTESAAMHDIEKTIALALELKNIGVGLAIDGFGIGHSNLRALARLPLRKIKLDGSFVHDIIGDPATFAIANMIAAMAHQLGLKLVAEMVETEGQVSQLLRCACDVVQGYYFSPALEPAELARLLRGPPFTVPGGAPRAAATRTVLVLDDDPLILKSVRRALKFGGYRVLLASRADEAFELLASNDVGVILCDQRLRETTGIAVLIKVMRMYPHIVRLMVSGYEDFDAMRSAINHGAVYRFLDKPFDNQTLRALIADAFERHQPSGH